MQCLEINLKVATISQNINSRNMNFIYIQTNICDVKCYSKASLAHRTWAINLCLVQY